MRVFFLNRVVQIYRSTVGQIGKLFRTRSLSQGFEIGIMTGMGAAVADGFYGIIAGFGLTAVSLFLTEHKTIIQLVGGLFLFYLGVKIFFTSIHPKKIANNNEKSSWHAFITTFFLTLANPATILSFIAIFAGLGLGTTQPSYWHASLLVGGVIIGSALWWLFLSSVVAFVLHHKLNTTGLKIINYLSGIIILVFTLFILVSLIISL